MGYQAGYQNTLGQGNTFFGVNAGRNISTGSHNTIVGNKAGPASVNSDDNVCIGFNTGQQDRGNQTDVLLADGAKPLHNATAIGYRAVVAASNALVLGNGANVGIGTATPRTRLEVVADSTNRSGLRLTKLTNHSPATTQTPISFWP